MIGWLASTAGLGVAIAAGWHSMSPRSQVYGRTFIGVNHGSRQLALTYDDGPSPIWTPRLLEVLAKHEVRATFFMLGEHVERHADVAQAVASAGHVIGNHTFSHRNLIFSSPARVVEEIQRCRRVLSGVIGEHSNLFRPPFGGRRPDVLKLARAEGFEPVMWSVSSHDWDAKTPEEIERRVSRQVRGGDVILMHDAGHVSSEADRSATIRATDSLIAHYKTQGYHFVTVPEMMDTPIGQRAAGASPR